ncbi:MAG: hypothetical protein ACKOYN_11630 [Planctomycetota bacterium]
MPQPAGADIAIDFRGPFGWLSAPDAPSVFESVAPETAGIYLWTIDRGDGHLVFYVGETGRCLRQRLAEHYAEHAAARYSIYEPALFATGVKSLIWPGYFGKSGRDLGDCVAASIELAPQIAGMARLLRFFIAPTTCDTRIRRRAEAAIADALYAAPGAIGGFQYRGVRYQRIREDESPIRFAVRVAAPAQVLGLPEVLVG